MIFLASSSHVEIPLLWERKKRNRSIIFHWYASSTRSNSLILFLFRTNYLARDVFIDKQSSKELEWIRRSEESLDRAMSGAKLHIHESRMRSSERKPIIRVRTNLIYNYGYESVRRSRRWKIIIIKAAISCVRTIVLHLLLKVFLTIGDPLAQQLNILSGNDKLWDSFLS